MKSTVADILRRAFENAVANWPLLLIRIGESVVMVMLVIGGLIATVVPFLVRLGIRRDTLPGNPADAADLILSVLIDNWIVIVYAFILASVLLLVMIAIHSFVIAGCALVYVDRERNRAAQFSGARWFEGGRQGWWPVFWIYNVGWSAGLLILLIPLIVLAFGVILLHESPAAAAGLGCLGLIVTVFFGIIVGVVTNIWVQKAIVDCLARGEGAMDSLGSAWAELKADTGRHVGIALIMIVVTLAGSAVLSSFSMFGSFGHHNGPNFFFFPLQFSASIVNSIFSAAVACWFLASFAALAVESRVSPGS